MTDHKEEAVTHEVAPARKGGVMNTLYPPGPQPGVKGRMKNHCRKFWWCDCLVFAIIVLVIVLPIIYVAIPKKAQKDINESDLEVLSQELSDPGSDSFKLKLVSLAKSYSSFHPTIDGFEAALSLTDNPDDAFVRINIPKIKAESETEIVVEEDITIENMDRFKNYTKTALGSETFIVHLMGKTTVHQTGLEGIDVDYNKKVEMKGLNKLAGLSISDLEVLISDEDKLEDGSNLLAKATIPNPSVMTLTLGNVTLNLAVDGKSIGTSLIPNLTLKPGENVVNLQSIVNQIALISAISTKYTDGVIPLEITGNSTIYNGEHLPYFEEALQENKIMLDLDAGPALAALGLDLGGSDEEEPEK